MKDHEKIGEDKQQHGREKVATGKALGDRSMQFEGMAERAEGAIQEGYGKAKRKVEDLVDDVRDRVKD
jgi:uncharacterized protein YjbJ (UPF0337 family)